MYIQTSHSITTTATTTTTTMAINNVSNNSAKQKMQQIDFKIVVDKFNINYMWGYMCTCRATVKVRLTNKQSLFSSIFKANITHAVRYNVYALYLPMFYSAWLAAVRGIIHLAVALFFRGWASKCLLTSDMISALFLCNICKL